MKKHQILNAAGDQQLFSKKVPVAATALTLFQKVNPSNVLSPILTPKLIFREVNLHSRWGRLKIHLPRLKNTKTRMSLFHWF